MDDEQRADVTAREKLLLATFLALGIFTRAFHLGDKGLWGDEGYAFHYAKLSSVSEVFERLRAAIISPLPNIIDYYWIRLVGETPFAIHLQTVIWSVLTLFLFAYTCYKLLPKGTALGAIAAFSLSAFPPLFAQTMRYYALSGLFGQLWLMGFLFYWKRGGWKWLAFYATAMAVAMNLHLYHLYAITGIQLFAFLFGKKLGIRAWPLLAANVAAAATVLPRFLMMSETGSGMLAKSIDLAAVLAHLIQIPVGGIVRVFFSFCAGTILTIDDLPLAASIAITLPFAVLCVLALRRARHNGSIPFFCAFALFMAIAQGWLSMLFTGIYFTPEYYVPFFGLFCVLLGAGSDNLRQRLPAIAPATLAAYVILSFTILGIYWTRLNRPENLETIISHVIEDSRPGDFLCISPPYFHHIQYYWNDAIPLHDFSDDYDTSTNIHSNLFLVFSDKHQIDEKKMERWYKELASNYDRVWMFWMFSPINTEDARGVAQSWMDAHLKRSKTIPYRMYPYSNKYYGELVLYDIPGKIKSQRVLD